MNNKLYLPEVSYKDGGNTLFGRTVNAVLSAIRECVDSTDDESSWPFPKRIAVVGHRGSGKTSILRMVADELEKSKGLMEPFPGFFFVSPSKSLVNPIRAYVLRPIVDPTIFRESNSLLQAVAALLFQEYRNRISHLENNQRPKREDEENIIRLFERVNRATYFESTLEPTSQIDDSSYTLSDFGGLLSLSDDFEKLTDALLALFSDLDFESPESSFRYKSLVIIVDDFDLCLRDLPLAVKQIINYLNAKHLLIVLGYDRDSLRNTLRYHVNKSIEKSNILGTEIDMESIGKDMATSLYEKLISPLNEIEATVNEDNRLYRKTIPLLLADGGASLHSDDAAYMGFLKNTFGNPDSLRRANSCINVFLRSEILYRSDSGDNEQWLFNEEQGDFRRHAADLIRDIYAVTLDEEEERRRGRPKSFSELLCSPFPFRWTKQVRSAAQKAIYKQHLFMEKHQNASALKGLIHRDFDDIIVAWRASRNMPYAEHEKTKFEVVRFSDLSLTLDTYCFFVISLANDIYSAGMSDEMQTYISRLHSLGVTDFRLMSAIENISLENIAMTSFLFSRRFAELFDEAHPFFVALTSKRLLNLDAVERGKSALTRLLSDDSSHLLFSTKAELKDILHNLNAAKDFKDFVSSSAFDFVKPALLDFYESVKDARKEE